MSKCHEPPAIVRPAESPAELAPRINAELAAGEDATRKGLQHYRAAGELLLRAKEQVGRGKWLPWLKENVRVGQSRAYQYMELAKLPVTGSLAEEWQRISGNAPPEEDAPPAPQPAAPPGSFARLRERIFFPLNLSVVSGGARGRRG